MTTTILPERDPVIRPGRNRTGSTIAKYLCVKLGAVVPDSIAVTAADTDIAVGITREDIVDGANGDLAIRGQVRATASGAITAGARVAPDANGKVKAAATGDCVIGEAKDTTTTDGDILIVELNLPGYFLDTDG